MILILFGGLRRQTLRGFFDKLRGEGEILLLFFVQSWKVWWKIIFSVRSKMFSRSNSASAPNTVSMKRPCGVVVPMFSFRLTNSTPFSASIERNLIVTGLYPNEIPREGKEWSGLAPAPDIKELFAYVAIINRISFAVFKCKLNSKIISECSTKTVLCVYIPANCPSIARTSNAVFFM